MKTVSKLLSIVAFGATLTATAQASLIKNGGFEDVGTDPADSRFGSSSTWQIYTSIPEWDASANMEIWTNNFIVPAYEGKNVFELNGHPGPRIAFSIFQDFATVAGKEYELTFAGRKRDKNSDEAFSVEVGDLLDTVVNQDWGKWNEYQYTFTATDTLSTLIFTSLDRIGDTTGNLFDDVKVKAIDVSEPASVLIFGAGVAGLMFSRRKNYNNKGC